MIGRQSGRDQSTPRLIAVAALGFLLLAPPLLSLFDHKARVFGIPILMAYLFIAWAAVIALVAVVNRGAGRAPE